MGMTGSQIYSEWKDKLVYRVPHRKLDMVVLGDNSVDVEERSVSMDGVKLYRLGQAANDITECSLSKIVSPEENNVLFLLRNNKKLQSGPTQMFRNVYFRQDQTISQTFARIWRAAGCKRF
ncbi:hypothetical protein JTB14_032334 [Gonioctena quinquepunctata]|nr:hypothetical protein JTB14_032334 [Gonioctena quinquepunctata]